MNRLYYSTGSFINNLASTCSKKDKTSSCELVRTGSTEANNLCYGCEYGMAVKANQTKGEECEAYTNDYNCRLLFTNGQCDQCWHSYYWDSNICLLRSSLIFISLKVLALWIMYISI